MLSLWQFPQFQATGQWRSVALTVDKTVIVTLRRCCIYFQTDTSSQYPEAGNGRCLLVFVIQSGNMWQLDAEKPAFHGWFNANGSGTTLFALLLQLSHWNWSLAFVWNYWVDDESQALAYLSNDLMCCSGTSAIPCRRLQVGSLMSLDAWMLHNASHTFPLRQNLLLLLRSYTVFHLRRVNHHCWPPQRKRLLVRTVRTVTLELAQQKHTKAGKVSCL